MVQMVCRGIRSAMVEIICSLCGLSNPGRFAGKRITNCFTRESIQGIPRYVSLIAKAPPFTGHAPAVLTCRINSLVPLRNSATGIELRATAKNTKNGAACSILRED